MRLPRLPSTGSHFLGILDSRGNGARALPQSCGQGGLTGQCTLANAAELTESQRRAAFRLGCLISHTAVRNLFLTGQGVCTLLVAEVLMGAVQMAGGLAGSIVDLRNLLSAISKPK